MKTHKGHLKVVVLKSLSDRELSGYALMKEISTTIGWKPSPGSIYPLLNSLLKDGYLKVKQDGRKKLYSITNSGKKHLTEIMKKKHEIIDLLIENMHLLDLMSNKKHMAYVMQYMEQMKKGKNPITGIQKEIEDMRIEFFRIISANDPAKLEKLKKLTKKTTAELKKIK